MLERDLTPGEAKRCVELLEAACKKGNAGTCAVLAGVYVDGRLVARDVPKAVKLLDESCAARLAVACSTLADLLNAGDGIARDTVRAKALMAKGCDLRATDACAKACDGGDGHACRILGDQLVRAANPGAGRIERAYQKACDAGAADGCYLLALRTDDAALALPAFERACVLGHAPGCLAAAQSYHVGRGVAADLATAARLYGQACAKNVSEGCIGLGGMYARGELGAEETAKGQAYLVKGCGEDVECRVIVANGRIPTAWGGSLEALRPQQVAPVTGPVRLGGAIETPKKTKNVNPMYPPLARVARIQGTVALECVISPLGEVTEVKVVRSIPLLDAAAIDAVRQWRYAPTLINGVAVPVIMTVPVNFKVGY
jgi:TonB family protein